MKKWVKGLGISFGTLLLLWFPLTWFFFGSIHPCGILSQRMLRKAMRYEWTMAMTDETLNLIVLTRTGKESPKVDVDARVTNAVDQMRRENYRLSPAECLRRSLIWKWDSANDEVYKMMTEGLRDLSRTATGRQ